MLHEINHPLLQHKLTVLRDVNTGSKEFRELASEITLLLAYEALKGVELGDREIETPLTAMTGKQVRNDIVIVPVLRAGIGMLDGMLTLVPTAKVGFVGMYRDPETKEPVEYYCKLPENLHEPVAIIIDPMLATGGSLAATVDLLKREGIDNVTIVSILSAPEGIAVIEGRFPDVPIYTAAVDEYLNDHRYIVPGLGDAGDRLYGTK
ncbi:MAG: uracil phosphoribosyltransferase [Victivallales bacterium]|nr:uracil phosphoribosyltransferase [Victivallales bacterium]